MEDHLWFLRGIHRCNHHWSSTRYVNANVIGIHAPRRKLCDNIRAKWIAANLCEQCRSMAKFCGRDCNIGRTSANTLAECLGLEE